MRLRSVAEVASALLVGLAVAAPIAEAAPGFVTQNINLRAGPGIDYPLVAQLPQGTPTEIFGCLPEWSWCDVAAEGVRGWVAGAGLQLLYDNQPEPLDGYGVAVGLPFIGFDVDNYWGHYYRGRPWFHDADRWRGNFPHDGRDDGPRGGPHGGPPGGFGGRDPRHEVAVGVPHGEPGLPHVVGPAGFQGPERGQPGQPERGPPDRGVPDHGFQERGFQERGFPERGQPERAAPQPGPHPGPAARPGPIAQAAPAGHPGPAPGRPPEAHGGRDQPPR